MKISLLPTLLFISVISFAQINKGSVLLGTDLSFSGYNNTRQQTGFPDYKNNSSNFNISLLAGKAVKNNLFAGVAASLSAAKTTQSQQVNTQKFTSYGGSFWMRKYFPVAKSFYAFVNGSIGVSGNKTEYPDNNTKSSGFGIALNLYPGISYQLSKSFYMDASLNNLANIFYNHSTTTESGLQGTTLESTSNNYGVSTSLGNSSNPLQLGIRWIIQK